MQLIAYVELNVLGMFIFALFYFNQRRSGTYALEDRLFGWMLLVGIAIQGVDALTWALDGVRYPGSRVVLGGLYVASYTLAPAVTGLWAMYCDLRVHGDERAFRRRAPLYALPIGLNTALLVVNVFVPLLFEIDAASVYHRRAFFFVYMVLLYFYLLWALVQVLRKLAVTASPQERREYRYMLLFAVPPSVGGLVQGLFYGISLVWACMVVSMVLIYVNVLGRQISTDALTGLNNRRRLMRYLELELLSPEGKPPLFVVMLDADRFKAINDTYGHTAGDQALVHIADMLKGLCLPRNGFLARLGGDEFVIVGRGEGEETGVALVRELHERVERFNREGVEPYQLSLSVGLAQAQPGLALSADALLSAADESMYAVKAHKKHARR